MLGADGNDDAGELAALAFVDGHGVGRLEGVELAWFVNHVATAIEADMDFDGVEVHAGDEA